jgi:hypothetical protein
MKEIVEIVEIICCTIGVLGYFYLLYKSDF